MRSPSADHATPASLLRSASRDFVPRGKSIDISPYGGTRFPYATRLPSGETQSADGDTGSPTSATGRPWRSNHVSWTLLASAVR